MDNDNGNNRNGTVPVTDETASGALSGAVQLAEGSVEPASEAGPYAAMSTAQREEAARLQAEEQRRADEALLSSLKEEADRRQKELLALEKEIEKTKDKTVKAQRDAIETDYKKQLKAIESELKATEDKRSKARAKGVKARIGDRTAAYIEENKALKKKIAALFKEKQVPAFCRTTFYYACVMPRGGKEILIAVLSFLLAFGAIPFGLYLLLAPGASGLWFGVIYLIAILLFGGIYVYMNSLRGKHGEAIREGRVLRNQIRANEKTVAKITREIRKDKDDSVYDLQAFDDQLLRQEQSREALISAKNSALQEFDVQKAPVLSAEIDETYREKLLSAQQQLSDAKMKAKQFEEKLRNYGKVNNNQGDF